jgi:hypothetical protein
MSIIGINDQTGQKKERDGEHHSFPLNAGRQCCTMVLVGEYSKGGFWMTW